MVDVENEVFTRVHDTLVEHYPDIEVRSDYVNVLPTFPYVSIIQTDSTPTPYKQTSALTEAYTTVTFDVNVYSNLSVGRKSQAKAIMALVDGAMFAMNFRRHSLIPMVDPNDAALFRMVARYSAATDGKQFYRG